MGTEDSKKKEAELKGMCEHGNFPPCSICQNRVETQESRIVTQPRTVQIEGGVEGREIPKDLAEGLDQDPRFLKIKEDLVAQWEKKNGPKLDESGEMTPVFREFFLRTRGLQGHALKQFRAEHPELLRLYREKEKTRVYSNPADDPQIQWWEQRVLLRTNKAIKQIREGKLGAEAKAEFENDPEGLRKRIWEDASTKLWGEFRKKYPEKCESIEYQDYKPIKASIEERPIETVKTEEAEISEDEDSDPLSLLVTDESELHKKPYDNQEEEASDIIKDFYKFISLNIQRRFVADIGLPTQSALQFKQEGFVIIILEKSFDLNKDRRWEIYENGKIRLEEARMENADKNIMPTGPDKKAPTEVYYEELALTRLRDTIKKFRGVITGFSKIADRQKKMDQLHEFAV